MKKDRYLYLLLLFLITNLSFGQVVVESPEYHQLKASGSLGGIEVIANPAGGSATVMNPVYQKKDKTPSTGVPPKTPSCNCYVEPDGTYTLALAPNDDGSSSLITIPFNFSFYGQSYNQLYINNNGNVTFVNSLATFSANAFPSPTNKIVAPFWGDVDTRAGNGQVVYKMTAHALFVNWEEVGYYNQHGDKRNTFQLILTDGTDPSVPNGQNIAFCYQDMQWTTGDASSGVNGFGGVPATAGANKGDNIGYFQLARFDHAGVDFDGALGQPDGISWLDYKSFFFDISNSTNIPPIPNGVTPCDTFKVCSLGDTADIPIVFFSPENTQTTTVTYDAGGTSAITQIANVSGNTAALVLRAIGTPANAGYHTVTVTATDNGTPVGVTTFSFVIWIDPTNAQSLNPVLTPLGACDSVTLSVLNGPYDTYLWDDITFLPTAVVQDAQEFGVTVSLNGCYKRVSEYINVMPQIIADIQGNFALCPNATTTELYIADSLKYSYVSWDLTNPTRDTMYINDFPSGTYTLSLIDSAGFCSKDTTFTITQQQPIVLVNDFDKCVLTHQFAGNVGGSGQGQWSVYSSAGTPQFSNINSLNPMVTFPTWGTYHLVYLDNYCGDGDTIHITLVQPPYFDLESDFFACAFQTEHLVFKDSLLISEFHWGIPIPAQDTIFTADLYQGIYTASYTMFLGCTSDTTFTILTQPETNLYDYPDVCGDSIGLVLNTGFPDGSWSVLSMPGTTQPVFSAPNNLQTSVNITDFGTYQFMFSDPGCNDTDTVEIKFTPYPWFDIADATTCIGDPVLITAYDLGFIDNYIWNTGVQGNQITAVNDGLYILTGVNECGTYVDSAYLTAEVCVIEFPNVFTPDGDAANNTWSSLQQPNGFKTFKCTIFNRWGNVVYEYDQVTGSWDGKINGQEAADGVYFYSMEAETKNGKELSKQGFFHLIRK